MGNYLYNQSQTIRKLDISKLTVACLKVREYIKLRRDNCLKDIQENEKQLLGYIGNNHRDCKIEYDKFVKLKDNARDINACDLVLRCVQMLITQSNRISDCQGDVSIIPDIVPFVETALYGLQHLHMQSGEEFNKMFAEYFGQPLSDTSSFKSVDPSLILLFNTETSFADQINQQAILFIQRNGIALEFLNQAGHQFTCTTMQGALMQQPQIQVGQTQEIENSNPYGQIKLGINREIYDFILRIMVITSRDNFLKPQDSRLIERFMKENLFWF